MNDLTCFDLASQRVAKYVRVKSQQELVIVPQLVPKDEANWDQLGQSDVVLRGFMLDRM